MRRKLLGTLAIAAAAGAISTGTAGAAETNANFFTMTARTGECSVQFTAVPHWDRDVNPSVAQRLYRDTCERPAIVSAGRTFIFAP